MRIDLQQPLLRRAAAAVSLAVVLVLLAIAPFGAVLEIHHALAAVDHDGHEHSDSDLCSWVQHHVSTSLFAAEPPVAAFDRVERRPLSVRSHVLSARFNTAAPSRAPPLL